MAEPPKKVLTGQKPDDISLSEYELRILKNMRKYAKMYEHADLCFMISSHGGVLKNGTLDLSKSVIKL